MEILNNGLVTIQKDNNGSAVVDGRELHQALEVGKKYTTWIQDKIKKYEFIENVDFFCISQKRETQRNDGQKGVTVATEYILTIDTAKEIAMIQNNEKGRLIRKYFIECEKKLKEIAPQVCIQAQNNAKVALIDRDIAICKSCNIIDNDECIVLVMQAVNNNENINELIAQRAIKRVSLKNFKKRGVLREKVNYIAQTLYDGKYDDVWHMVATQLKYTQGINIIAIRETQKEERKKDLSIKKRPATKVDGYLDIISQYDMYSACNDILDENINNK